MFLRTRGAGSYDNYLFPNMIGRLAMLKRMKHLAFKCVLVPAFINHAKEKKEEKVHTLPGNEGMYP